MRPVIALLTALPFLAILAGCSEPITACTQVGCEDGLYITVEHLDGSPLDTFSGEATLDGESFDVSCDDGTGQGDNYLCLGNTLEIQDATDATEIHLDLVADDDTLRYQGTLTLDFAEVQPNGPDCPPTCLQASETIALSPVD